MPSNDLEKLFPVVTRGLSKNKGQTDYAKKAE